MLKISPFALLRHSSLLDNDLFVSVLSSRMPPQKHHLIISQPDGD